MTKVQKGATICDRASILGMSKEDKIKKIFELEMRMKNFSDKIENKTERLKELRKSLPDKFQVTDSFGNKVGNIAYSISEIEGYTIKELKSFSKYGSKGKNGIKNPIDGWVSSVENPVYSNYVLKVNSDNEIDDVNGFLRNNDTEYKILEYYNQVFKSNYEIRGKILIVSEREICPSCDNVIKAFSKDYKNIEITLVNASGKTYIVKAGEVKYKEG